MMNRLQGSSLYKTSSLTTDLVTLPTSLDFCPEAEDMADWYTALQKEVQDHLEQTNLQYKASVDKYRREQKFREGDLVMIHIFKA